MQAPPAAPDPVPRPLDHLARRGEAQAPALIDRAGSMTYAELDDAVGRLAAALRVAGLREGDRLASWLAKTRLACLLPLACARAGLVHVPINPLLKRAQVAHILADSEAAMLIAGKGRAEGLEPADLPAGCTLVPETSLDPAVLDGPAIPLSDRHPGDLVQLLYTSGSTGRPKGVMLSHANLWLGALGVAHYLCLAPEDRTLAVLPLSFDYGQNQLLSSWSAGAAAIPIDYLTPRDVIAAIGRHDVTTLAGVPPLWTQLAEADWPDATAAGLRRITNSGGRLPVPLVGRLRSLFPRADLYSMYGLTEAFRSTFLDPALIDAHPESIGRAIPFAEVTVVAPDGRETPTGEAGELVHAGPLVALGYWRDPARTAERFRPAPSCSAHAGEPAVWSGDSVMRDEAGLLRFVGRDDEMIKTAGNRVSPSEIEEAALASGVVAEAVAIGLPDEWLGAAIELVLRGDPAGEPALRAHLRAELPNFMQPRAIHWRDALPRNPNGKLDRVAIRREMGG